MKLTARQREILEGLWEHHHGDNPDDDHDLIYDKGGGWWFGLEKTSGKTCNWLLAHALIKPVSGENVDWESTVRFEPTGWARKVLDDPDFEPMVEILRLRAQAEGVDQTQKVIASLSDKQKLGLKYLASEIPGLVHKVHKNTIYSLVRKGLWKDGQLTELGEWVFDEI